MPPIAPKPWHAEALKLHAEGMNGYKIALILGVPHKRIYNLINPALRERLILAKRAERRAA